MAVSSVSNTSSSTEGVYENPNAKLGGEEFLQMFLTELQYQDPTEPMDNEKILEQTSQLSSLETNEKLQESLKNMATALSSSSNFSVISAIGKTANTGAEGIVVKDGATDSFDISFSEAIESGTINILNSNRQVVKTIDLSNVVGQSGTLNFAWNGTDSSGNSVADGKYTISGVYTSLNGNVNSVKHGVYPVESVKFDNGNPMLKLGSKYYSLNDIEEIY